MTEPLSSFSADEAIAKLVRLTDGIHLEVSSSTSLPPVMRAVYGRPVRADDLIAQVEQGLGDASHVVETSLALAEVIELAVTGQDPNPALMNDASFRDFVVNSKFRAGWVYIAGGQAVERDALVSQLKSQGFDAFAAHRPTSIASFVELVARYAFIYGRCSDGDVHQMSHFVEQNVPAAVVALGPLDALDAYLILGAMRFGIPAIVPNDFTYPFGYQIRIDRPDEAVSALLSLPNMHVKTRNGGAFSLPPFMSPGNIGQDFQPAVTIGGSAASYLDIDSTMELSPAVAGTAQDLPLAEYGGRSIGIRVFASNAALDAALLGYVESFALRSLNYITGVKAEAPNGRLTLKLSQSAASTLTGSALVAAVKAGLLFHFGKLEDLEVSVQLDQEALERAAPMVLAARDRRVLDAKSVTEESSPEFYFCTGCSTFALGHVCIITPERVPMCGRNWVQIKAGAYLIDDDLSRSFKRRNQMNPSSTGVVSKGRCIDPEAGEYEGVNAVARRESGGKVNRVSLHSVFKNPHSCCSCFLYLVFYMPEYDGFGIMNRNWKGKSPDGRTWADLANEVAGRQREGIVGVNLAYIRSPKFLQADGGLSRVMWMTGTVFNALKASGLDLSSRQDLVIG